mmetsp:Transcript_4339/g.7230  ORF Transcript_4339/g.7230 Transcript_4339/m.7230 type:complete len:89 (+) Transcript_4339:1285-1551(+)
MWRSKLKARAKKLDQTGGKVIVQGLILTVHLRRMKMDYLLTAGKHFQPLQQTGHRLVEAPCVLLVLAAWQLRKSEQCAEGENQCRHAS